jgi:integrase
MSHLLKRRRGWYVTVGIAPSIRKILGSKTTHVVRSLHTRDEAEAISKRKAAVNKIQGELLAIKEAAAENGLKAAAELWKKKIAAKQFDAAKFVAEVARVQRSKGDLVAAELSARSFGLFTDLDHMEAEWFGESAFDAKTESRYRYVIKLLREHMKRLELEPCIELVNSSVAISFRKHLVDTKVHKVTGNSYFSALSSRWRYLQQQEAVKDLANPWAGIRMPKGSHTGTKPKRRPWRDDELVTFFTKGKMRQLLFDISAICVTMGMRRGEPFKLKVKDVDGNWFFLPDSKSPAGVRRMPIPPLLQPGLKRILKGKGPEDFLFDDRCKAKGQKPGKNTGQAFLLHRRKVGIDGADVPMHSLRHWYSTMADTLGFQRHQVQALIGHDSGEKKTVTTVYTQVMDGPKLKISNGVVNALPAEVTAAIKARFGRN